MRGEIVTTLFGKSESKPNYIQIYGNLRSYGDMLCRRTIKCYCDPKVQPLTERVETEVAALWVIAVSSETKKKKGHSHHHTSTAFPLEE